MSRHRANVIAVAVAAVVTAGVLAGCQDDGGGEAPASAAEPREQTVTVNGHPLYVRCRGEGSPGVLLDAGLGGSHTVWDDVLAGTVELPVRVCAYDRLGVGESDGDPNAPAGGRPMDDAVADLRALLDAIDLPRPYVLVSHSIAGLIHRPFTVRYPDLVGGLVMVDSAPDDWDVKRGRPVFTSGGESLDVSAVAASLRTGYHLGDRPTIVIRAARTTELSTESTFPAYWSGAQAALAGRSDNSMLVVADSNHGVPYSQPRLIARSIELVVTAVRDHSALPACGTAGLATVGGSCEPPRA